MVKERLRRKIGARIEEHQRGRPASEVEDPMVALYPGLFDQPVLESALAHSPVYEG